LQTDVATVFSGFPVKNVWRFNDDKSPVRFTTDSSQLAPDREKWLTWFPSSGNKEVANSLHAVHGGHCYLIELDGSTNRTLSLTGRPIIRPHSWQAASYSLTNLCIQPGQNVTFTQFFTGSAAHTSPALDIRRIQADGSWVATPASTVINRNEAYWIYAHAASDYQGPACVVSDARGQLDFGTTTVERTLELCNMATTATTFTLMPSAAVANPTEPSAGAVALQLWRDGTGGVYGWENMTINTGTTITVPARVSTEPTPAKKTIRLALRRTAMTGQGQDRPFQSLLTVTALNTCQVIGLRADGFDAAAGSALPLDRAAGLWVGHVTASAVNEPAGATPSEMQPTATPASFRVIVRVDPSGQVHLLREAYILWLKGLTDAEGIVTENGKYIIAGSGTELSQMETAWGAVGTGRLAGSSVREGQSVGRRISTTAFSFTSPQPLAGSLGTILSGTVTIPYTDPRHPYVHRFHPDHDNLDARYENQLPEGKESFTIGRQMTFTFTPTDPENLVTSGWGDDLLGGTFQEIISGLHKSTVRVTGTFRLNRIVKTQP
jgi:hypothetical protein